MKNTKHTLVIVFNQFYPEHGVSYVEVITDEDGMFLDEIQLKRKPRKARFDKVMETGEGEYNQWNASKARKIYGHSLQKKDQP